MVLKQLDSGFDRVQDMLKSSLSNDQRPKAHAHKARNDESDRLFEAPKDM